MGDVVVLDLVTKWDIPVDRCIKTATEAGMTDIVIVGFDKDGNFFFSSNKADAAPVVWFLEMAKYKLLKICDEDAS